jgi:SAM-dependent methyltransferase
MQPTRKSRGAWYTPPELVHLVVDRLFAEAGADVVAARTVRVLDPACGDGRFLVAVAERLTALGCTFELVGCDIDGAALGLIDDDRIRPIHADALALDWDDERFDIVVGNPPFLSQMAATTTRGGSSRHGGGPYADAAVEFLALAVRLARPDGGRIALVLPQSILAGRDGGPVREAIAEQADLRWSWWEPRQQHFDASVNVCVLGFVRPATGATSPTTWTRVVTDRLGVPALDLDELRTVGTLGDRAELNVNFRDEYYALVPAVSDDADGPPLVTSGLIDPGRCLWGHQTVRFAKRSLDHPRVDLSKLTGRFPAWATRKLVPKVLVANQTRIIEAVADPDGAWLPGVPVTTVTPLATSAAITATVWELAAVLTSPVASVLAWHAGGGTGLSTTSVRVGPAVLAATPWPAGSLTRAVSALHAGDIEACGRAVTEAYGLAADGPDGTAADRLVSWWVERLPRDA